MNPTFAMEEAALKAALRAYNADRNCLQRRADALDCVALVAQTLNRLGANPEALIMYLRNVIIETGTDRWRFEDELIQHAIAEYYR